MKDDGLCIQNDRFCIQNDVFCINTGPGTTQGLPDVCFILKMAIFAFQMFDFKC